MLLPTSMNKQKFLINLEGNKVRSKALTALYTKLGLGIIKCHLELGTGTDVWEWIE